MTNRIPRREHIGQKGFTLVEVLLVNVILGVLAALIVPNFVKYVNSASSAVQKNELAEMQHSVAAAMADIDVNQIAGAPVNFGNTGHVTPPSATNLAIGAAHLSDYISGGLTAC